MLSVVDEHGVLKPKHRIGMFSGGIAAGGSAACLLNSGISNSDYNILLICIAYLAGEMLAAFVMLACDRDFEQSSNNQHCSGSSVKPY